MDAVPDLIPISDLRLHQTEILAKIEKGPIVLAQRSKAIAVMVSVKQWNELLERLELLEDSLDALEMGRKVKKGEEPVKEWSVDEGEADALRA